MEAALTGYEPLEGKRVNIEYAFDHLKFPHMTDEFCKIIVFQRQDFSLSVGRNNYEPVEPVIYEFVAVESSIERGVQ